MIKQMRQWQNVFTVTLILMCVGIDLSHNIEAALALDHGEHCSICVSGNSTPAVSDDTALLHNISVSLAFEARTPHEAYNNYIWPDYTTRAPPLV